METERGDELSQGQENAFVARISVVIPTFNRAAALMVCLEHLERQTTREFEVIVVDDGSTDGTAELLKAYAETTPLRLRHVRQQNAGPSRARNLAISMAVAPVVLMIGDDILGCSELVERHLRFHDTHPAVEVAALGLTRWAEEDQTVTPLMRWLEEGGIQFAYRDLERGVKPDWQHFWTSNLSLKREMLRANPFQEAFTRDRWMMEDLELGYRLERTRGLRLMFLPEALAGHLHPTTFRRTCDRMYDAGLSAQVFHGLWPELRPAAVGGVRRMVGEWVRRGWVVRLLTWVADGLGRVWCPNPLMRVVLRLQMGLGYRAPD